MKIPWIFSCLRSLHFIRFLSFCARVCVCVCVCDAMVVVGVVANVIRLVNIILKCFYLQFSSWSFSLTIFYSHIKTRFSSSTQSFYCCPLLFRMPFANRIFHTCVCVRS